MTNNQRGSEGESELPKQANRSYAEIDPAGIDRPAREVPKRMRSFVRAYPQLGYQAKTLVISGDEAPAERLAALLGQFGFITVCATSMAMGGPLAATGQFQVVLSEPRLSDGYWTCLTETASRSRSEFMLILVAKAVEPAERIYALRHGVFDVIDVSHDLPGIGEAVTRAVWVGYLTGCISGPEPVRLRGGGTQ